MSEPTQAVGVPLERRVGRLDPERDDFLAGICVALQCVTASDDGVLWREIVQTAGVESLLRYATFVEPDEWQLAGFRYYAQRVLHRARPRKCVPSLKTPNVGVETVTPATEER